jgi:hypothetical protein
VWVIDTKRYKGKIEVVLPWFGTAKLKVAGRDQSKLITGLAKQVERVQSALVAGAGGLEVPVHGCLCFVDAEWPWLSPPTSFGDFYLVWPKALVKRINADGGLTREGAALVAETLARRFPQA